MTNPTTPLAAEVAEKALIKLARNARKQGRDQHQIVQVLRRENDECAAPLNEAALLELVEVVAAAPVSAVPTVREIQQLMHPATSSGTGAPLPNRAPADAGDLRAFPAPLRSCRGEPQQPRRTIACLSCGVR